jgi:N6-adenosine-specific RNA methylase IME4
MSKKFQVIVADPAWSFQDSLKMSDVARGAQANYNTMTISQIKGMPVKDIADPNGAILALWVPSSLLQEGLDVMKAWGFKHKQTYVWVKVKKEPFSEEYKELKKRLSSSIKYLFDHTFPKGELKKHITGVSMMGAGKLCFLKLDKILAFGMGRLFRQTHEICLIGTSNNKIYKKLSNKSQRSVSFGENLKHSAKPEHLQDSLEIMFPDTEKLELFARRLRPGWKCLGNEVCNGEDIYDSLAKLI